MNAETPSIDLLKYFLKEMFQFNANDLDFGIYKIYNLKRKEIEGFIDGTEEHCLEPTINRTLKDVSNLEKKVEQQALFAFLKTANQEGLLTDTTANYETIQNLINILGGDEAKKKSLSDALKSSTQQFNITDELKDKIYNHILGFFEMYYSNGDFGYNNRSRSLYKVPYEADYDGNDTMFHWKHKGSLYIKTGNAFNAIKFKLNHLGKEFELRLETNDDSENEGVAQNNNKDTQLKHYKFNRFEDVDGVTRIVFNLSSSSTTKADLFKTLFKDVFKSDVELDKYLFSEDKPVFSDLTDDYDKVQDGSVKGIGALRVKRSTLLTKINKNFPAGSKVEIVEQDSQERFSDETLETLYNIDQKLNSFYIGNDSDYFIHEDLHGFLTQEKERFIKNYILGDLSTILNGKLDNTTLIIAKAFNDVTDRIIEFLSAIEEFQKKLFTMKKKIVECEYCLTIDNINEQYYPEILANQAQLTEWENLFSVKVQNVEDLKAQPTLVLDTKFFKQMDGSNAFKDKVLAEIDFLDKKTNGILINSENYQALNFLKVKYKSKVKCVYIDPPYNTRSDGFVYKDSFKSSSWNSMFLNRVIIQKSLMKQGAVMFTSIDDNQVDEAKSILKKELNFIDTISVKTKVSGVSGSHHGKSLKNSFEYLLVATNSQQDFKFTDVVFDKYELFDYITSMQEDGRSWKYTQVMVDAGERSPISEFYDGYGQKIVLYTHKNYKFSSITRIANDEFSGDLKKAYYKYLPRIFDTQPAQSSIRTKVIDASQSVNEDLISITYIPTSGRNKGKLTDLFYRGSERRLVTWLKDICIEDDGVIYKKENAGNFWSDIKYNNIKQEGDITFPNGKKPLSLVSKCIDMTCDQDSEYVLDYFAGSGTTGHAVIEFNARHTLNLKYILVEAGKYFESTTKRRIKNVVVANTEHKNRNHIFKYKVLEQYEDVLDGIEQFDGETPKNLPLKYLYKPELNQLESSLDLSKPFSNQVKYGQPTKVGYVELVETYNYLQGYEIKTIKPYNINNKYYKVVETTDGTLVVWRDIALAEDDSEAVKTIIGHYPDASSVDINFDFNILATLKDKQLPVGDRVLSLNIIHAQVFSE